MVRQRKLLTATAGSAGADHDSPRFPMASHRHAIRNVQDRPAAAVAVAVWCLNRGTCNHGTGALGWMVLGRGFDPERGFVRAGKVNPLLYSPCWMPDPLTLVMKSMPLGLCVFTVFRLVATVI